MRWKRGQIGQFGLLLLLVVAGCKTADRSRNGRDAVGTPAAHRDQAPGWLDPSARMPGAKTGIPKGGRWSDPSTAARDALGGRVVDAYGRPARNVFIRIEPVPASSSAPMGIYSDDQGYFLTHGLKPGQSYQLTAETQQEGRRLRGIVQTKAPNTALTLVLREDTGGTPNSGSAGVEGQLPPPEGVPRSRTPRTTTDGAFSPEAEARQPVPPRLPPNGSSGTGIPPVRPPATPSGPFPPPQDLSPPIKPEHTADGPRPPYSPPPVSIPGPPTLPNPLPPQVPLLPGPPSGSQPQSRTGKPLSLVLVDPLHRPWSFPGDSPARLVVLEFVTSECPHCRPVVSILKELQSRYGAAGLQVVAVLCDELPFAPRLQAAQRYAAVYQVNYPVYVEPGASPGRVRDAFGVEGYPTAVVLDGQGQVLWKGHPGRKQELENVIRQHLHTP